MANRDTVHSNDVAAAIPATTSPSAGDITGAAIDTLGYNSIAFYMVVTTHTAGTLSVKFEHANNSAFNDGNEQIPVTDAATISRNYQNSTTGLLAYTGAETGVKKIGLNLENCKRYVRAVCTVGATPAGVFSGVAVLGHPRHRDKAV